MWYDEAAKYYTAPNDAIALSQGDIVVAPTAILCQGEAESNVAAPTDLGQERLVTLWRGRPKNQREAPTLFANVRWGLAMVLPHSCAMQKDWNEQVNALKRAGRSQAEAEAIANADATLDPFVVIAPVLTYDTLPDARHAATANGSRLGVFPVCGNDILPAGYIDFARLATVRQELAGVNYRVAQLSALTVGFLKHSIATYFAARSISRFDELSAAVGQTVVDVLPIDSPKKDKIRVSIALENGLSLVLEGDARATPPGNVPERKPRELVR